MHEEFGGFSDQRATFGDRLTLAREAAGLTREALARRLGVRVGTIRNWEADRAEPRANRMQMLAGVLGVPIVWLMTGEGPGIAPQSPPEGDALHDGAGVEGLLAQVRTLRRLCAEMEGRLEDLERQLLEAGPRPDRETAD